MEIRRYTLVPERAEYDDDGVYLNTLSLPIDIEFMKIDYQVGIGVCIWVGCDPTAEEINRKFYIVHQDTDYPKINIGEFPERFYLNSCTHGILPKAWHVFGNPLSWCATPLPPARQTWRQR